GLIVTVPVDTVPVVAVEVRQGAVETLATDRLHPLLEAGQRRRPPLGGETNPGIAVIRTQIAVPGIESGNGDLAAGDADAALVPRDFRPQPGEVIRGLTLAQKPRPQLQGSPLQFNNFPSAGQQHRQSPRVPTPTPHRTSPPRPG